MTLDPRSELTRQWRQVAADDLRLAELASRADPAMLSGAVYRCQQAFEKALKAFLVWHGQSIPRTPCPTSPSPASGSTRHSHPWR